MNEMTCPEHQGLRTLQVNEMTCPVHQGQVNEMRCQQELSLRTPRTPANKDHPCFAARRALAHLQGVQKWQHAKLQFNSFANFWFVSGLQSEMKSTLRPLSPHKKNVTETHQAEREVGGETKHKEGERQEWFVVPISCHEHLSVTKIVQISSELMRVNSCNSADDAGAGAGRDNNTGNFAFAIVADDGSITFYNVRRGVHLPTSSANKKGH